VRRPHARRVRAPHMKRVAFGGLELGTLAPGKWRVVAASELRRAFPHAPLRILDS